jgi:hypothetical protein
VYISFTEIWFAPSSLEMQRMKFLLWLRKKCIAAGYENVRLWSRSVIAKPGDASDHVILVECANEAEYFRLLPTIAGLCSGMQKRFVEAGGIKWAEGLFSDAVSPVSNSNVDSGLCETSRSRDLTLP